ncbi:hypothetical protein AQJ66_13100 [Streptomyces bungoensis]|uniref:Uncharacterized protein n=1 Tax=Streptomyces bungoensis TaxID=285568 RepID=A0A101T4V3_9ACTN|nr:hypothetical protein [Streptomyces bungoensis]KUN85880.1 hypothetical protein AQJ66_13100 [Streptomyces bungoensis]
MIDTSGGRPSGTSTVRRVWDLGDEEQGYRVTSHRYAFTFLVPFRSGDITVSQEVRADNRGVFGGTVTLPSGVE